MTLTEAKQQIEAILDQHGLTETLQATAEVCADKAEHLRTNWQDESQARVWDKAVKGLLKVAKL